MSGDEMIATRPPKCYLAIHLVAQTSSGFAFSCDQHRCAGNELNSTAGSRLTLARARLGTGMEESGCSHIWLVA